MRVVIAGAGIGGLSAALSLHAAGIEAIVIDSAASLRPLGVGINLMPHAVRELTELGLGDELEAAGIPTAEMVHFDRHGNRIWGFASGRNIGYRWPQYSIHRGELQMILLAAVRARLGRDAVRTGTAVTGFSGSGPGVQVRVRDRVTGTGPCSTGWPRSCCPPVAWRAPTGTGPDASRTCCPGSRTGSSAGWTCPR